jgi:hypothetical protein
MSKSASIPALQAARAVLPRFGLVVAIAAATSLHTASDSGATPPAARDPQLPHAWVDTTLIPPSGATVFVRSGGDFQAALDSARPGEVIGLEAGATFTGPFTLPAKSGSEWITVRPAVPDDYLPMQGIRVDPAYAVVMPKLESGSGSVVTAAPGAHHYRFIGVEIRPKSGVFLYNLVTLGARETDVSALPHHIIFDRCYLHGDPKKGARRGVAMNSAHTAVIDSHLSDFKEVGADSQAIAGWNGLGPFKIVNNYLEGAGENLIFGGTDPSIPLLVPSDIEVRHNHFSKPLSWKIGDPTYEGTPWAVKNLFELKNARRVLVDGNLFEHNWVHAQAGFAILFTVRNQDGAAPWSVVEDVTFTNNTIRHVAAGINVLGHDDNFPSQQTKRVMVRNNLFDDVGTEPWGANGRLLQVLNRVDDLVFEHNTAFHTGNIVTADRGPHAGFVYRNNIAPHNAYGMVGTDTAPGHHTLSTYFPGATIVRNVIAAGRAEVYPGNNFFPPSLNDVGFVDRATGDYSLGASSPYKGAGTDGKDIGVVFSDFRAATAAPVSARKARPWLGGPFPTGERGPVPRERGAPSARTAVFWAFGLILAYTCLGHPLLLRAWSSLRSSRRQPY